MIDYIIVGFGLAGMAFAEQLRKNNKSFVVVTDDSQQSSKVAGGLYNPVILKRFTMAWDAPNQLKKATAFYEAVESYLGIQVKTPLSVLRRFNSVEEQNLWMQAIDKPGLQEFLSDRLEKNANTALDIPYQFGLVKQTGRVDVKALLEYYLDTLAKKGVVKKTSFDFDKLEIHTEKITYGTVEAKHIVFCEGYGMLSNPYFNQLPMVGNKGEYLIIKAADLQLDKAVKSAIFILPLGGDRYKVGATYNNHDTTSSITAAAKAQIIHKLEQVIRVPYQIIDQIAGIRPTVKDRKPLVGTHPKYKNMHLLNGFGSRGIMIAPSVSEQLYDAIEHRIPLDAEIDLARFMD